MTARAQPAAIPLFAATPFCPLASTEPAVRPLQIHKRSIHGTFQSFNTFLILSSFHLQRDRFPTLYTSRLPLSTYFLRPPAGPTCSHSTPSIVEMFPKSFIAPLFLFALTSSVNAHAAISPALGVKGTPSRNDVQRPSTNKPCGNVDIGKTLDSSTAVPADASGTFAATAINFNP